MLFLRFYLWIAPNVLLAVCLIQMLRRGLRKRYPIFLAYLVFELVSFMVLLTVDLLAFRHFVSLNSYRWVLSAGLALGTILQLCVLYELANQLILSRSSLGSTLQSLLRWTAAILLLIATIASAMLSGPGIQEVMSVFQTLDLSSSAIELGLMFALLLFSRALRISWRSVPAGILVGFAILASAEMAASGLLPALGARGYINVDLLRMTAFHMCALVWVIYLSLPEGSREQRGEGLKQSDLEFWDQELQRMVRR